MRLHRIYIIKALEKKIKSSPETKSHPMKKFAQISDVGRGRLLFKSGKPPGEYRLYLTTTYEYVLCKNQKEAILSLEEAIRWAIRNRLSTGKQDFIRRCVDAIRIPFKSVVPKVRLYSDDRAYSKFPSPESRAEELIQHPIFNSCLIKHRRGIDKIDVSEVQRSEVISIVEKMYGGDYFVGSPILLSPSTGLYNCECKVHAHGFRVVHEAMTYDLASFTALAPMDLPFDMRAQARHLEIDEITWLRIPDCYEIWDDTIKVKFALIAIAVCIHFQLNCENVFSLCENPLEINQSTGIYPNEDLG